MPFPACHVPFPSDRHRGLVGKSGMPAPPRQAEEHPAAQHDEADHAAQQGPFRALCSSVNNEVVFQGGTSARQESLTIRSRKLVRLGTVAERPLGADPVDPSDLNSHERSCILDSPPSQLLNAARRPADSFDDARPATIVGRGSSNGGVVSCLSGLLGSLNVNPGAGRNVASPRGHRCCC